MQSVLSRVTRFFRSIGVSLKKLWKKFRSLKLWMQAVIVLVILALIGGGIALARSGKSADTTSTDTPTVSVESIAGLSGNGSGVEIIGSVRSVTEADILAQAGGTVRSVHTSVGKSVPAGFIIAELENASERASVLQAQGGYDAAVAARNITSLQSGNATQSLAESEATVRNLYQSTYNSLDTALSTQVDTFFGAPGVYGPDLLIKPGSMNFGELSRRRADISDQMDAWRMDLVNVHTENPDALLTKSETILRTVSTFLSDLATEANATNSGATPAQRAALAQARTTVDGLLSSTVAARDAYNAKKTAAAVGSAQSQSSTNVIASADANVEQALGGLRAAQAQLEKTYVRAPIGGTVNFLPIRVGDYVAPLTHVATVAQNGALEIVAYVSEDNRNLLAAGSTVMVQGTYKGIVTSVAPALDPTTKQIEVHVAVNGASDLVNGQSVRITIPGAEKPAVTASSTQSSSILLPLAAVKLSADKRSVFSVGPDSRLVAHTVEIGQVQGDRIQILTQLPLTLEIVTDARGLSEGEKVTVAAP